MQGQCLEERLASWGDVRGLLQGEDASRHSSLRASAYTSRYRIAPVAKSVEGRQDGEFAESEV